ncbi:hypothetical protein [Pseudomonas graminis]
MNKKISFIFVLPLFFFSLFITSIYVGSEHNIYFWDYNGYWSKWEDFVSAFKQNPFGIFAEVKHSVRHDDYNTFPIVLISIFKVLPVSSRLAYISSLFICYFIPTVLLFSSLVRLAGNDKSFSARLISLIIPATFTAFWVPTLRGFPDICGLIFIIWSVIYCTRHDFSLKITFRQAAKLGLLLWAAFLLRRWYAFTIVSLYISLPVFNYFLYNEKIKLLNIRNIIINFFISGASSILLAILFQGPLLEVILATNYSYIYSAYQTTFTHSIDTLINNIGVYSLGLLALSVIIIAIKNTRRQWLFLLFSIFNLVLSFILFTNTQTPGVQHNLPFSMWILFIIVQGGLILNSTCKSAIARGVVITLVSLLCLIVQLHSLFGFTVPTTIAYVMPRVALPLRVDNYDNYLKLGDDITRLTQTGANVTVLSSSYVMNNSLLNTLTQRKREKNIVYVSQVDLRDRINIAELGSEYFIVTDPVQTHLRREDQQVITIPSRALLEHQNIGKAFVRLDTEYNLTNNTRAWIYKKVRPYTVQELNDFLELHYHAYPQWRDKYVNAITYASLFADIQPSTNGPGSFTPSNEGLEAKPGIGEALVFNWTLSGLKKIHITLAKNNCPVDSTVTVKISGSELPADQVTVTKGSDHWLNVAPWQGKSSTITIEQNTQSDCTVIKITDS